jgi:hypothetical protein
MHNFTVKALKVDVNPPSIKIIYDAESSSYVSGSNWYAILPDGKKYKCNKMRREDACCVKVKNVPTSKSKSDTSVSTNEEQEPFLIIITRQSHFFQWRV